MPVAEAVDSIRSNHFAPTIFSPASQGWNRKRR
jgi:hypothetical protein